MNNMDTELNQCINIILRPKLVLIIVENAVVLFADVTVILILATVQNGYALSESSLSIIPKIIITIPDWDSDSLSDLN